MESRADDILEVIVGGGGQIQTTSEQPATPGW